MGRVFSLLRNSRGQSLTEFALILPLLLVLVGGIVDFGLVFFIGQVIQNAAHEGARIGATTSTPGPVQESGTFPDCQTTGSAVAHVALEVKRPQKRRRMQHFKAVSPQNQHEPKILYETKDIWQL